MNYSELAAEAEDTDHSAAERAAAASRSTWVSVVVNLVLTTTQIAVGLMAKSQGLVADGIHSLSDLVADFVVLRARPSLLVPGAPAAHAELTPLVGGSPAQQPGS